jgi:hypothetical protein
MRQLPSESLRRTTDATLTASIRLIDKHTAVYRPVNTNNQYSPKKMEYKKACYRVIYPNEEFNTKLQLDETYKFLFYQAHRNLRSTGGKKKEEAESADSKGEQ